MSFISKNWRGLTFLTLGIATVLAGLFLLENCADAGHFVTNANGMKMHMGCTWTERAVLGLGGLTAFMGLVMLFMRESARALSLAAAAGGALMIATPLWLIPTCANPMMTCNLSLKPGVLTLGGLIMVAGLAGVVQFVRAGAVPRAV